MRRLYIVVFLAAIAAFFMPGVAEAVTYSGGSEVQRAYAQEVIESCWLDYTWADARVDEVDVVIEEHHDPYWDYLSSDPLFGAAGLAWWGNIRIHAAYVPGPSSYFGEIVAHEWSHQIWFAMPYKWTRAWTELCTEGHEGYDPHNWYTMPAENFAECARVALFDAEYIHYSYPRTNLNQISTEDTREFITTYRWGVEHPFTDLTDEDIELEGAAGYLYHAGIIEGYDDNTVGPYQPLLKRHVALICERMGIACAFSTGDWGAALRGDVRDAIPGLSWNEERWTEPITRGQLLRLMYRARDAEEIVIAQRLEAWFAETYITYQGTTRQPRLIGHAALMVQLSREYNVPLWLALGQCWRESQWGTTGLSINYNCLWGVKDTSGKWGELAGVVSGFANYTSIEECIRAYFRLMNAPGYRALIDAGNWRGLLDRYAPASENDTAEHYQIVMAIKGRCEERGIQ